MLCHKCKWNIFILLVLWFSHQISMYACSRRLQCVLCVKATGRSSDRASTWHCDNCCAASTARSNDCRLNLRTESTQEARHFLHQSTAHQPLWQAQMYLLWQGMCTAFCFFVVSVIDMSIGSFIPLTSPVYMQYDIRDEFLSGIVGERMATE